MDRSHRNRQDEFALRKITNPGPVIKCYGTTLLFNGSRGLIRTKENDMAYDEGLAQRIREMLDKELGLVEKKMFGGVGFMLQGNMACGVQKDKLIVRVGLEASEEALSRPHTLPFDITGRAMKGWVMVNRKGYESDRDLKEWVQQGVDLALTLQPK
jgi:TfoX/Sxy family transcriptional regulator of competence genes